MQWVIDAEFSDDHWQSWDLMRGKHECLGWLMRNYSSGAVAWCSYANDETVEVMGEARDWREAVAEVERRAGVKR